jgi:CubicO group peptidase (beta-lactamase class C family)
VLQRIRRKIHMRVLRFGLFVFLLSAAIAPAEGQTGEVPSKASIPAPKSYSSSRDELIERVRKGDSPSFAVAVVKDGKIVWEEGIGWADREKGIGAGSDTEYALASISKSITAAGIAIFESKGRIKQDSRISGLLGKGWMKSKDVGKVTVAQILSHTSGIPHLHHYEYADVPGSVFDRNAAIRKFGFIASEPGTRFLYTNLGYSVLAAVIEKLGGGGFEDVMKRELFGPLGMNGTTLNKWTGAEDAAAGYRRDGKPMGFELRLAPDGGAGFFSTAHDLALYSMFQIGADVPKGMESATITEYLSGYENISAFFYDRGWGILKTSDHTFLISDGQMAGASTAIVLVPEEKLAVVVLCNRTGAPALEAAVSITGAAVPGLDKKFGSALDAAEKLVTVAGELPYKEYEGTVKKGGKKINVRITFAENQAMLSLGGGDFKLRDAGWDRGALQLIAPTGLNGESEEKSDERLVFALWPDGERLYGTVQEELNDDRPRWGVPYKISLRRLKAK